MVLIHLAPVAFAEARRRLMWGSDHRAHGSRQREATQAQLPLTSSITLEERKRGLYDAAHQYTSHPRFRPAGLYG